MSDRDDIKKLADAVAKLIIKYEALQDRVGVIENNHAFIKNYKLPEGISDRLDKIEFDLKASPLFNKELIEKGNDAIDKRRDDIDKGYEKFKAEDAKVRKEIEDEGKRFIKDTEEKIRKTFKPSDVTFDFIEEDEEKDPEDDNGNGDVPKF